MGDAATADAFVKDDGEENLVAPRRRLSRKRAAFCGIALLALAGGGLYGRYWWETGRFIESTDDAYVGGDVTVIAPRVPGVVAEVLVRDNQRVAAGDLLIRLDDRDYRAALAKAKAEAEASVAGQDATLLNLAATRRLQEAVIAQNRAELVGAEAEAARTRFDVDRYRELSAKSYTSEQRFQQADADDKKATSAVAKARASLDAAERRIAVIDTQSRQADAARAQAVAERDAARLNLGYTEIRAPTDGVVGNRSARAGSYATTGAGLIALVPADGSGSTRTSRRASSRRCVPARASASSRTCYRTRHSPAMSKASPRLPARSSACCRPRTPQATSPRLSSGCRCVSASTAMGDASAACAPVCR
nr:HlyD family secretion protein [Methylobacterium aquaticum]